MGIQAWMIKSWPACEWYLPNGHGHWPSFQHANTHVRPDTDAEGRRNGETIWCAEIGGIEAGAAWEWTEIAPGVVLLSNPNCVATNLQLLNAEHRTLAALDEVVALNTLVHSLPWQLPVCAALQDERAAPLAHAHALDTPAAVHVRTRLQNHGLRSSAAA